MPDPSFGQWPQSAGGGGTLVPAGWAEIQLSAGSESINHQVGGLLTGVITVNGTGDWDLDLDPAAGLIDPFRIVVTATPMTFSCRILVASFQLPLNLLSLRAFDAAGAAATLGRCGVVIWYDP